MDNNLSLANMMPGGGSVYGGSELQGSMRVNHHQNPRTPLQPGQGLMNHPSSLHEILPLKMGQGHSCDQPNSMADYNKGERVKNSQTDEEDHSSNGEGMDGQNDPSKGKNVPQWHRVKWNNSMVKLLITAISYLSEDAFFEGSQGRRKYLTLHKKGKWKSISKVMAERGFFVSPQQCEDKFNDLNKRYKKLNEILGKGTSCQVVEKPAILDMMDHISEKEKDEVRKILSSKHLFYEELCSYHNNNRLHLPPDPALQQSLQLALRSRDDNGVDFKRHPHDDAVEDDDGADSDDHEDYGENYSKAAYALSGDPSKRMKQGLSLENFNFRPQSTQDFSKGFQLQPQNPCAGMHPPLPESQKAALLQNQWLKSQALQLEEQKIHIESEALQLEKQRLKWQRFCKRKDQELEKLKMENDRMKLENDCIALELKRMEMSTNSKN